MRNHSCPKCQGSMAEGYILDSAHGYNAVSNWIEGAPVKSMWTGVKLGKRKSLPVQSWRCGRCGFLEFYARDAV